MGHPGQALELFGPCCGSFAISFLNAASATNPIMTSRVLTERLWPIRGRNPDNQKYLLRYE
jgi:hypothetical protein